MAVTDFIALDVETANADFASICSIGLVHFRKGSVFKSLTVLVDPEDHFDPLNISIHGIKPADVAGQPTMEKVLPVIANNLADSIVVHHSSFDKTAFTRSAERYNLPNLPCIWLDTVRVARITWPSFENHKLATLAAKFDISFIHHDAAEDARAAGMIMLRAIAETGTSLEAWVEKFQKPFNRPSIAQEGAQDGHLKGEFIVFTGALNMPRTEAAALAASAGCTVLENLTKKTTILVVGDQDLRLTNGKEKSTKHIRADEYINKGAAIRIVRESDFLSMLRN